jgi:poly(A) polymerase/tRNA nucleotidyltransferase (CCA-adding enzyme)
MTLSPAGGAETPALRIQAPHFLADPALGRVLAALPGARLVGGCVRDTLAGRDVADIDIATPMPPDEVLRALAAAGLKSVPTGLDHGTVTAIAEHRGFEVTTLRRDIRTDGRHAEVAFTDDWRADAARRDFTINAMSMAPAEEGGGAVFDYFGGIADLGAGRVRFVGDAATRIAEDYLRVLRFFRFFARYGTQDPDAAAIAAIAAALDGLDRLSGERVWSELKRILAAADPDRAMALMRDTGVLGRILPSTERAAGDGRDDREWRLSWLPPDPMLRLAALRPGDVADRLRLSMAERDRLAALLGPPPPQDADDPALRRLLADTDKDILLGRAWLAGRSAALRARIEGLAVPVFPFQGRDLQAAGLPPGPAMGAMLRDLRAWWLAGGCVATAQEIGAELARRRAG